MQVFNHANSLTRHSRIFAALVTQSSSKRSVIDVNCSSSKSLSILVSRPKERSWTSKIMAGTHNSSGSKKIYPVKFSEDELRKKLTPEQFRVTQEKGTERPYTGEYTELNKPGFYHCVVCDTALFDHTTKFESHCGWPAFYASKPGTVDRHEDHSHGMERVETVCSQCGAHLGHVFTDGPKPTGERYCINSASLKFKPLQK